MGPDALSDPLALRYPHNIFFSIEGRAGLASAIIFVLIGVGSILKSFRLSLSGDDVRVLQSARGLVACALTVAMTDVYLESPQGLILYWSAIGVLWWLCQYFALRHRTSG